MQRSGPIAVGLDMGTSKIAVTIGTLHEGNPMILAMTKSPSAGIRKGVISEIEECISALSSAMAASERIAGMPIQTAVVGIEGSHITTTSSKGIVAVNRGNSEITGEDAHRAIEAARAVALPPNQEILHVLPKLFSVDGLEGVKDPVGMVGIRLEVDTYIIGASTAALRNLSRVISSAGLHVEHLLFGPLAASHAVLDKAQKENGVILVDFGAATTSLIIFEEGDIVHANVLPIGSSHITNDIAIGLRTNLEIAERIKQEFAYAISAEIGEDETIELSEFDPAEESSTSRKYVCEIVEARLGEIFSMIRDELRTIGKDGMLPAGVVFVGGGARLAGLTEAAKDHLQLPAQIGTPLGQFSGMIDKLDDPLYATSVGLMLAGLNPGNQEMSSSPAGGNLGKIDKHVNSFLDKAKGVFKNFMP